MIKFILGMIAMLTMLVALFFMLQPALAFFLFLTLIMGQHI